jgi:hypothetical protein
MPIRNLFSNRYFFGAFKFRSCLNFLLNQAYKKIDVCSFPQKRTFTLPQKRDSCKNNASEEAFSFSSEELNAQFKSLNSFSI